MGIVLDFYHLSQNDIKQISKNKHFGRTVNDVKLMKSIVVHNNESRLTGQSMCAQLLRRIERFGWTPLKLKFFQASAN